MPTYNVHLYREMRLFFPGIEADTPEQAAKIIAEKATDEAATINDCNGHNLAALVDLVGDKDYSESITIDLDPMKGAAQELYEALNAIVADYNLPQHKQMSLLDFSVLMGKAKNALAKARGEALPEAA
jgi:hypothetical protein